MVSQRLWYRSGEPLTLKQSGDSFHVARYAVVCLLALCNRMLCKRMLCKRVAWKW
jgi:hypothetical protein